MQLYVKVIVFYHMGTLNANLTVMAPIRNKTTPQLSAISVGCVYNTKRFAILIVYIDVFSLLYSL
jgi:hypothetical protein